MKKIHWDDKFQVFAVTNEPVYKGVDGAIEYEITQEYNTEELKTILKPNEIAATEEELDRLRELNASHEEFAKIGLINPYSYTMFQPFSRNGMQKIADRNVWAWNGNRDAPTLTPSWLMETPKKDIKIHLYFTNGKINLLPDSNVELIA